MPEFQYADPFPLAKDATPYRKLSSEHVSVATFEGREVLKVAPEALTLVAREAFRDVAFLYRPGHLAQLAAVLEDPEASENDRGVVLSLRQLRDMESAWIVALNHLVTALVLAPLALGGSYFPSGIQWLLLAGLGIVQMGLPYVIFARGLKHIPGHEATGIGLAEPLLVPVWVYLAWGDKPAWWTLVGGGLILVGLAIRYFAPTTKVPAAIDPPPPLAPG